MAGSAITLKGDFGISLLLNSTLTLCGPTSSGARVAMYPSGIFFVGSSMVWPRGLVTLTLHGASGFPDVEVMTVTGRGSPTLIAVKQVE